MSNEKCRFIELFMTQNDEKMFCEKIREYNPNIYFLDTCPSTEADISKRIYTSVINSSSPFFSIVNFDLTTMEELQMRYEKYGEYYHFCSIAREQMQFLRSRIDPDDSHVLREGRIADSYSIEDKEEKEWKDKVYKILKKYGEKVFWLYQTSCGCYEISKKPEKRIVAYTDAIHRYNWKNGYFMKQNSAMFVCKNFTIKDLE